MKLYKYYAGQVESVVVKENNCQYKASFSIMAFEYKTSFFKNRLAENWIGLSEKEALELALKKYEKAEDEALVDLQRARFGIGTVKKIMENHNG